MVYVNIIPKLIISNFFLSFILVDRYFILSVKYPKIFGKYLINFFEKNASKEILNLLSLKKSKNLAT